MDSPAKEGCPQPHQLECVSFCLSSQLADSSGCPVLPSHDASSCCCLFPLK